MADSNRQKVTATIDGVTPKYNDEGEQKKTSSGALIYRMTTDKGTFDVFTDRWKDFIGQRKEFEYSEKKIGEKMYYSAFIPQDPTKKAWSGGKGGGWQPKPKEEYLASFVTMIYSYAKDIVVERLGYAKAEITSAQAGKAWVDIAEAGLASAMNKYNEIISAKGVTEEQVKEAFEGSNEATPIEQVDESKIPF